MAHEKKPDEADDVIQIRISGPQGVGKTAIAFALASIVGGEVDGVAQPERADWMLRLLEALRDATRRHPYTLRRNRIAITTTNTTANRGEK